MRVQLGGDFANAEIGLAAVRHRAAYREIHLQVIEILRPHLPGPPQAGIMEIELRKMVRGEGDLARFMRLQFHVLLKADIAEVSFQNAVDGIAGSIYEFCTHGQMSNIEARQVEVCYHLRIT